ncbi:MAG TPA: DUF1360 domain-containing protein [Kineosporiaceae bacterium]|nr:DUF1360 domain-containing protein [Kineosporiaceae bacterium]
MSELKARAQEVKHRYAHQHDRPLGSFIALIGAYSAVAGAGALAVQRTRQPLPERLEPADLALLAVATHKIARLLAKDPVTSPLRAPFTRFEGTSGEAELAESVPGTGLRKALGELATCPFCLGHWVATGLAYGFILLPRATRWTCSVFTALTAADFLQLAYAAAQQAEQNVGQHEPTRTSG